MGNAEKTFQILTLKVFQNFLDVLSVFGCYTAFQKSLQVHKAKRHFGGILFACNDFYITKFIAPCAEVLHRRVFVHQNIAGQRNASFYWSVFSISVHD